MSCVTVVLSVSTIPEQVPKGRVQSTIVFRNITIVQDRHNSFAHATHIGPVRGDVTGGHQHNGGTSARAMLHGLSVASQNLAHYCNMENLRIAPLIFSSLGSGTLMQAWAPYILLKVPTLAPQMEHVFVPISLARQLLRDNLVSDPPVDVDWILTHTEYDINIEVNEDVLFAVSDPNCDIVETSAGKYSAISIFTHELMHGMGLQSHISPDHGGGISNYHGVSIYDANLHLLGGSRLLENDEAVNSTTAMDIQGLPIFIANHQVYNPSSYEPGSSLHHLLPEESVMSPQIPHSQCKFELSTADLEVLNQIGWQCAQNSTPFHWELPEGLGVPQTSDHTLFPQRHCHSGCWEHSVCVHTCNSADEAAWIVFVILAVGVAFVCVIWVCTSKSYWHTPPTKSLHAATPPGIQAHQVLQDITYTPFVISTD